MALRAADLERVRALDLFAGAADGTFRDLMSGAYLQRFPAHTTLIQEGDATDFLHVLMDGSVELVGTWNEKEMSLGLMQPVAVFVLAAVALDAPALTTAETRERSEVLLLPAPAVRRAMAADPAFCFAATREMAVAYEAMVRSIKNQKLRGGVERLANYLVAEHARQGGPATITLHHEKRVLASLLGMTPENLSRAFSALADYGVSVHGPQVTITLPKALNRLAKPTPLIDSPSAA
jgi:CRP/FNR family transcriptional activator FtrB